MDYKSSFIWREICIRAPIVVAQVRWLIGDGTSIDVSQDAWVSSLLLSRWPTYVSMEVDDGLWFSELIANDGRGWRTREIVHLFNSQLANRILAILIPIHKNHDLRV